MADTTATVRELRDCVQEFVRARDWERFHNPKDLAVALSIEASELLQRFLWEPPRPPESYAPDDRAAFADELADVAIYTLSFANAMGIDLSEAVLAKVSKNEAKYPAERFRGLAP
ncbi:MAG TPA: nucleotide pyrophosphohydrolase [Thermoplasmata archaeon]|jgi:NTP pyrophosphatase (non-canonical NTP hydrolase)